MERQLPQVSAVGQVLLRVLVHRWGALSCHQLQLTRSAVPGLEKEPSRELSSTLLQQSQLPPYGGAVDAMVAGAGLQAASS